MKKKNDIGKSALWQIWEFVFLKAAEMVKSAGDLHWFGDLHTPLVFKFMNLAGIWL